MYSIISPLQWPPLLGWRQLKKADDSNLEIVLGGAGENHIHFTNAYAYIQVETAAVLNNEIEIAASR